MTAKKSNSKNANSTPSKPAPKSQSETPQKTPANPETVTQPESDATAHSASQGKPKPTKPDPKATPKPTPKSEAKATTKPASTSTNGNKLGIIAIVVSLGLSAFIYWHHQQNSAAQQLEIDQLESQISTRLEAQISSAIQSQSKEISALKELNRVATERVKALESNLAASGKQSLLLKEDIANLQRNIAEMDVRRPNDWMLAEAEYLMRMAARKLWLEHDVESSIALLLATDQRIMELSDPSLSPLRQAIINDITTLEALPKLDKDGLVLKLTSLEQQVDNLNIAGIKLPESLTETDTTLSSDVSDWRENLKKSWQSFADSFITIERRDGRVEALLAPDQAWYLKENIKNQITKAQLAVYREHQAIYTESLTKAAKWISQYYDQNNPTTGHLVDNLTELSKKAVTLQYPDQLKAKPVLEEVIDRRVKKSLATPLQQETSHD
ncbi:uroporphyrinogen-III C-methyltransferase [Motilimonas eburnea]|uniref:uroporphyrinogen-III C-methyltransferase n=1 Tax=Motilimonas eburnea TaxID=1737488 RepID=UPI001E5926F7|nr:uroporphyrinogen-III C-methyltransferase [Motilimonas eburnea]MCE2573092.1 uroporphyrinogen-III C-methyltransferase [Motilimonas eburnea]